MPVGRPATLTARGGQGAGVEAVADLDEHRGGAGPAQRLDVRQQRRLDPEGGHVLERVLARRGSIQEAERLAREAVRLVEQTDWLQGHADALMDLAEVLRLAGRTQNAAESLRQALQLYDHKGNLVLAAKARNGLRELARNR
jgi:Flp pilus assembly protein TadD